MAYELGQDMAEKHAKQIIGALAGYKNQEDFDAFSDAYWDYLLPRLDEALNGQQPGKVNLPVNEY